MYLSLTYNVNFIQKPILSLSSNIFILVEENVLLMSISPTFYKQLVRQFPFAKKNTNTSYKYRIAARITLSYKKAARKVLMTLILSSEIMVKGIEMRLKEQSRPNVNNVFNVL